MGFSSPAIDYLEPRLALNNMLIPHPSNMMLIETPDGFVLVDHTITAKPGESVGFQFGDYRQVGGLFNMVIITKDGETIDGDGPEGTAEQGKVTAEVLALYDPYRPII